MVPTGHGPRDTQLPEVAGHLLEGLADHFEIGWKARTSLEHHWRFIYSNIDRCRISDMNHIEASMDKQYRHRVVNRLGYEGI